MFRLINKKFIFASLIMTLVLIFIINIFVSEVFKKTDNAIVKTKKENSDKISGVRIHQKSKRGEKFLIVAETLKESKTEANKVILENSLTTIDNNGILTKIVAGYAIVSNNYENFNFSEKVKIIKKSRNFVLAVIFVNLFSPFSSTYKALTKFAFSIRPSFLNITFPFAK